MRALFLAGVLFMSTGNAHAQSAEIAVRGGILRGISANNMTVFRAVPFAAPPVGPLRWKPPQAVKPWQGVRDATRNGPVCPQVSSGFPILPPNTPQSEDCLTLNVFAPVDARKAPVMVWFHGGGHRIGAGSQPSYEGDAFVKRGVVLVSVNYRLGALGYMVHPALTAEAAGGATGNYGDMDKVAALKWVQANIAAFGGDPANVTIFGESAGGQSVLFLLANPEQSRGLVAKAISQSGGGWFARETAAERGAAATAAMVAAGLPERMDAAALRALPVEKLVTIDGGFRPFADGIFYKRTPFEAFSEHRELAVPLVIGANDDEGSLIDMYRMKPEQVSAILGDMAGAAEAYGVTDETLLSRLAYGDRIMVAPARAIARLAARNGTPVWRYAFTYRPEAIARFMPRSRGAIHGMDVSYVFGGARGEAMAGKADPRDAAVAERMNGCWAAFARSGVPCEGSLQWPRYGDDDRIVEFGAEARVIQHYRSAALDYQDARQAAASATKP